MSLSASLVKANTHYLHPGNLFVSPEPYVVTTILGSCISVCLWDTVRKVGGINHYLLPLWNGEGLPTPKYGNVAISKLIERMVALGSSEKHLVAKAFGGASINTTNGLLNVGQRNLDMALEVLDEKRIQIVSSDLGGMLGRRVLFHTDSGKVMVRMIKKTVL